MGPYLEIILAAWVVFIVVWLLSAFTAKRNVRDGAWRWSLLARLVIALIAFLIIKFSDSLGVTLSIAGSGLSSPIWGALGAFLTVLGVALAVWARIYLGRNWGMPMSRKETPELVTDGPYQYIRHPIYTGILFAILGSALASSLWWLVIFGITLAYFLYAAHGEEKLMLEQFPTAYPAYLARTKRLVPFIY